MHICIEGHKLYMILLQVTQMSSYRASGPGGDLPKVEKKYPGSTTFPRKRGPWLFSFDLIRSYPYHLYLQSTVGFGDGLMSSLCY